MKITISGMPGSGKSTIGKLLAKEYDLEYYSGGSLFRKVAKDQNIDITDANKIANEEEFLDKQTDEYIEKLGKTKNNIIVESRLAYHFIPDSYKIFLKVSPEVSINRIMERENINRQEAIKQGTTRHKIERDRYQKKYGIVYDDLANFDLVVDVNKITPEEIIELIKSKLEK